MVVGTHRRTEGKMLEWMKGFIRESEMRTVMRETYTSWSNVTSRVPQMTVLAPIIFQIYIDDMQCGMTSYINLFADDATLLKFIQN